MVSYRLNALIDPNPFLFHAVNLLLHVLVSVCVHAVGRRILRSEQAAFVAAGLFAVHPVHTEAVANIVGRAELLAGLFALVAILLVSPPPGRAGAPRWPCEVGAALALALGTASKESALVTPVVLGGLWYVPHLRPASVRRGLAQLVVLAAVGAGFLTLRVFVVGTLTPNKAAYLSNPLAYVSTVDRLRTAILIGWQYAELLFVPAQLAPDYSPEQIPVVGSFGDHRFLAAVGGLGTMALFLARACRTAPELVACSSFLLVPFALTGNVFFPIGINKAERLLYFPSIGWCLIAGWIADRYLLRSRVGSAALVMLLTAFAARTIDRNRDWENSFTLWSAAVETTPHAARAQYNYATALSETGRDDLAIEHHEIALRLYPRFALAAALIGTIHHRNGRPDAAFQWYQRALAIDPRTFDAHLNLGVLHFERGEPLASLAELLLAHEARPDHADALANMAAIAWTEGLTGDALRLIRQAESSFPLTEKARRTLADLKGKLGER
jgi:tetratricopeptide (TPR) repeat protein